MSNGDMQASSARQLQAWRLALHAAEMEKAAAIARYDEQIAALRQAIKALERQRGAENATAEDGRSSEPPSSDAASSGVRGQEKPGARRERKRPRGR